MILRVRREIFEITTFPNSQHQDAQDAEAQRQEQQLREAQALEAQRALRDSSRAVATRNRQAREQQEALRDEVQERIYQARVHCQVPRQDQQAPPQVRQDHHVHREHEDKGNPPRQEQHEVDNPPRQEQHEVDNPPRQEQHEIVNHQRHGRHHPRPQHNDEQRYGNLKFTMRKFTGRNDPEEYISWALKVDKIFRLHNYEEEKKIAMASLEFQEFPLIWWEQVTER